MRKKLCLAAGATMILLAGAPAAAHRLSTPRASARPVFYNPVAKVRRGLAGGVSCVGRNRNCVGDGFGRGRGRGFGGGLIGYAYGGLIEDPESLRDQGFFADTGNSWTENGRAVYDYDRGYPYDWYRDPAAAAADAGPPAGPPMVRCEVSWVAGATGMRSPVRVCRGRR
jgi:hypothetical protein